MIYLKIVLLCKHLTVYAFSLVDSVHACFHYMGKHALCVFMLVCTIFHYQSVYKIRKTRTKYHRCRFIPFVGLAIAGGISFSSTYYFLHQCLKELEGTALDFVDEMTSRTVDDFDNDRL
jgi:hypothetical protein